MIDILKLTLNLKCLDNILLPRFAPATIRGAFGIKLKRVACVQMRHGGNCQACLLKNTCIYSYIFEPHHQVEGKSLDIAEPPHPYVLMAQFNQTSVIYPKGSTIQWFLNLFGSRINELLPYIILTAEYMGQAGLGRDRGKFAIDNIIGFDKSDAEIIYQQSTGKLKLPLPIVNYDISANCESSASRVRIRFNTPVRIQRDGKFKVDLSFYDIVINIFRRYSLLVKYYQTNCPDIRVDKDLLEKSNSVQIVESNLKWKSYSRYSARQKRRMILGGFVGDMVVTGNLGPFIPLLNIGELINVGKNTSFGFGNFDYKIEK